MPHYDDITKPVQQERRPPTPPPSHPQQGEIVTHLRQSVPGVCIAIRSEPSVTSSKCGDINEGDIITVSGREFEAHDMSWFTVMEPVRGYCISRHPMARSYRPDGSLFVVVSSPPPDSCSSSAPAVPSATSSSASSPNLKTQDFRHSVPNVAIAIRTETSTSSKDIGTINSGDHIRVVGDEIPLVVDGDTMYWYKIVHPVNGYCISRHRMLPGDGKIFRPVVPDDDVPSYSPSCCKKEKSGSGTKTKLRHVLPNVSIALRAETSTSSKKLGSINTGDIITVTGDEISVNTRSGGELNSTWYRVVHPQNGYCISSHPLAQALRQDGKIFVAVSGDGDPSSTTAPSSGATTSTTTTLFDGEVIERTMRLIVPNAVVNVRHQPSMGSRVVGSIKSGEVIKADRFIRGINGMDWYRLVTPTKGGYCTINHPFNGSEMFLPCSPNTTTTDSSSRAAAPPSDPADYGFPPFPEGDSGVRKALFIEGVEIRIRASPSFAAEIIGGVSYNDEVVVAAERVVSVGGTDTEWYQITHPARGYVMSRHRCAFQKGYDTDNLFHDVTLPRPCPGSPTVQGIAITQDQPFVVGDVLDEPILPPFAQRSAVYQ